MPWREQVGTRFRLSNRETDASKLCETAEPFEETPVSVGVVSSAEADEHFSPGVNEDVSGLFNISDAVSPVSDEHGDNENNIYPKPSDEEVDEFLRSQQEIASRSSHDFELIPDNGVLPACDMDIDHTVSNRQFNSLVAHSFL